MPQRLADFESLTAALDYAARSSEGLNFYGGKGELSEAQSFAELHCGAKILARRMLAKGLRKADRVALVAETDSDFVTAFFACQLAGLVPAPMPLPVAFGGRDAYLAHIRRMVESAGARVVLAPDGLKSWIAEACDGLDLLAVGTVALFDDCDAVKTDLPRVIPDDLAYIQFSSGSTRFPLGVAVTQRAVMANARAIAQYGLKINATDRCVSWLPMFHDMGLVGFLLVPMACQMSVDYLATRDFARRPLLWLQLISENRSSLSFSPTFGYELCARRAETARIDHLDLTNWRAAGIGGDMVRAPVMEKFAQSFSRVGFDPKAFVPSYGMAEATLALSFAPLRTGVVSDHVDLDQLENDAVAKAPRSDAVRQRRFVLCGPPLPGHEIEVRDPDGTKLSERRQGRVFVRGPSLMREYFSNAFETTLVLSDDGWLDTGDLGYWVDGQIVISGRAKDLILINGRNLWPQDLEWAAETKVAPLRSGDVAAFSVDEGDQERVIVLVQCRALEPSARDELAHAVAQALRSVHGVEAHVVLVPPRALPQTSSGKLSRSRARRLYLEGGFAPSAAASEALS